MELKKKSNSVQPIGAKEVWSSEGTNRIEEKSMSPFVRDVIADISYITEYDLEVQELEMPIGDLRADIVCKDKVTGDIVVIENQLEHSDHSHLGKSLTYLSNLGAKSLVWICENFKEEHKKALECLNEITSDEFSFYGLELKFEKYQDSEVFYSFNSVVVPSSSVKYYRALKNGCSSNLKSVIWAEKLIDDLRKSGCQKSRRAKGKPYCFIYKGMGQDDHDVSCVFNFSKGYVEIYVIDGTDAEKVWLKKVVDSLNLPFVQKQGVRNNLYTKWIYEVDDYDLESERSYQAIKELGIKIHNLLP